MARGEVFPIVHCADLARTRAWYERVLAATLTYRFPEDGDAAFVTLGVGAGQIALGDGAGETLYGERPLPATGHAVDLCVYVPDLADTAAAAGDDVVVPPSDTPWGERVAYLRDPEGTMLLVVQDAPVP